MLSAFPSQSGAREATGVNCWLTQVVHEDDSSLRLHGQTVLNVERCLKVDLSKGGGRDGLYWGTPRTIDYRIFYRPHWVSGLQR